jgi:peroxiredoxin
MHTAKSLKAKKIILYFYTTKIKKKCFGMHFGFNNQFIKVMRTRKIFQKFPKNYFVFF